MCVRVAGVEVERQQEGEGEEEDEAEDGRVRPHSLGGAGRQAGRRAKGKAVGGEGEKGRAHGKRT